MALMSGFGRPEDADRFRVRRPPRGVHALRRRARWRPSATTPFGDWLAAARRRWRGWGRIELAELILREPLPSRPMRERLAAATAPGAGNTPLALAAADALAAGAPVSTSSQSRLRLAALADAVCPDLGTTLALAGASCALGGRQARCRRPARRARGCEATTTTASVLLRAAAACTRIAVAAACVPIRGTRVASITLARRARRTQRSSEPRRRRLSRPPDAAGGGVWLRAHDRAHGRRHGRQRHVPAAGDRGHRGARAADQGALGGRSRGARHAAAAPESVDLGELTLQAAELSGHTLERDVPRRPRGDRRGARGDVAGLARGADRRGPGDTERVWRIAGADSVTSGRWPETTASCSSAICAPTPASACSSLRAPRSSSGAIA